MKWTLLGWIAAAFMLLLIIGGAGQSADRDRFWRERDGRRASQIRRLQADNAQLRIASQKQADTVRRVATANVTLRDSVLVRLTDTVLVERFIKQTDTLRVQCLRCAALLDSLRISSAATIDSLDARADDAVQFAEGIARRQKKQRWLTTAALLGGTVLGAWLRGQ